MTESIATNSYLLFTCNLDLIWFLTKNSESLHYKVQKV